MEKRDNGNDAAPGTAGPRLHHKARFEKPAEYPERFPVADELVPWKTGYPAYKPPYYVSPIVLHNDCTKNPAGWADPEDITALDMPGESFCGALLFDAAGRPLNPGGRTGIAGRGLLGKWGPNYAADPIITRFNPHTGDVEMLAIQRRDNGQWAIPGGMVDKGEAVSRTLARELLEETGIILDMASGYCIYRGYVDDPRNTDHAWMETTAKHLHLQPELADSMKLQAGSDAKNVCWLPLVPQTVRNLYASHCELIKTTLSEMLAGKNAILSEKERARIKQLLATLREG